MKVQKTNLIIESFCNMSLSMLEVLLDDDKTYHDTTKTIFLEKINSVFTFIKSHGNTELNSFKGNCTTNCSTCKKHKKGNTGYLFVGNNSDFYISLIFEEKNNEIFDIYICNSFKSEKVIDIYYYVNYKIYEDEKYNFKPNIEYLLFDQKCKNAIYEIELRKNEILNIEIITYFTEKYKDLYNSIHLIKNNYFYYHKFWNLICYFEIFLRSLKYENLAREACEKFNEIEITDVEKLTNWNSIYRPKLYNNICYSMWFSDFELEKIDSIKHFEKDGYKYDFKYFRYSYEFTRHIFKLDSIFQEEN